ncbi:hypothetical protein [Mammaliicoccus lentus]|uniref:hypothetical protein n=1 Tax=Mammaliicoccus lentus TaxID=42858 RepID=UPI0024A8CB58|nr:hypothetical protein [Mammaliicoccus lentus]WHI53737.1 hypothetical protein PYH59_07720 [Mammaliicoccus lentus]WHI56325.1 hypothetical protein PYH49_07725 [Mammaliicoccus lentus]WHI64172.1 hypothetical protein PYH50_07730 [Mammaliicoccus lentus]WHI85066.1 hypothetical protein PYH60_07735 [Mammaliicoccus lentus]WHI89573.1 hypothetical protein PYH61_07725 [Mammaliicoccus lentus]
MYMLFEQIKDYDCSEVNIITVNENIKCILEFLSQKSINHTVLFEDKQIFYCDDKNYVLITKQINDFDKQEVTV